LQVSTDNNSNATLSVNTDEQFYITRDSNPATGYEWQIASISNPDVVEFVSSEYIPPKHQIPGAGGKQILTFDALRRQCYYNARIWSTLGKRCVPPASTYISEVMGVW
jgi:predicted secreted protein